MTGTMMTGTMTLSLDVFAAYVVPLAAVSLLLLPALIAVFDCCCTRRLHPLTLRGCPVEYGTTEWAQARWVRTTLRVTLISAAAVASFSALRSWCVAYVSQVDGSPASGPNALQAVIAADAGGMKNLMHAGLLYGTLSLFSRNRNARYYFLLVLGYLFMFVAILCILLVVLLPALLWQTESDETAAATGTYFAITMGLMLLFLLLLVLLPRFHKAVGFGAMPSTEAILPLSTTPVSRTEWWLRVALLVEMAVFVLGRLAIAWPAFGSNPFGGPTVFVETIIASYSFALHRAFILGTGWSGVSRADLRYIKIFVYANSIFAVLHSWELLVFISVKVQSGVLWAQSDVLNVSSTLVSIASLLFSIWAAYQYKQHLLKLRDDLAREPWFALPQDWSQSAVERPSLWNAAWDTTLSTESRRTLFLAACCLWVVLFVWIVEAVWMTVVNSAPANSDNTWSFLNQFLGHGTGEALNYGLHGVAMHIFAYFRSMQDDDAFSRRKMFHIMTQLSFAVYSGVQLINLFIVGTSGLGAFTIFLTIRLVVYLVSAYSVWNLRVAHMGFDVDVLSNSQQQDESATADENEVAADTLDSDRLLNGSEVVGSTGQDKDTRRIRFAALLQTLCGYAFFFCIAFFVAVLVVVERTDTVELSWSDSRHSGAAHALAGHSVAYGVAFHYLFIITGYAVRAGQDVSVLFLDVFRMSLLAVLPISIASLVCASAWSLTALGAAGQASMATLVLLFLSVLGATPVSWVYNRLILKRGYRTQDSHM